MIIVVVELVDTLLYVEILYAFTDATDVIQTDISIDIISCKCNI